MQYPYKNTHLNTIIIAQGNLYKFSIYTYLHDIVSDIIYCGVLSFTWFIGTNMLII